MLRAFATCLIVLLLLTPDLARAQTELHPHPPGSLFNTQAEAIEDVDIRRQLLAAAGALIGISIMQSLAANPAYADWMHWLSQRLLIVFGAVIGRGLFDIIYDVTLMFGGGDGAERTGGGA